MASQYATRIRALLAAALVCAASVVPTRPASAAPSMQQQVAGQGLGSRVILRLAGDPVAATERALGGRAATPDGAARLSQQAEALNALTAEAVALAQQAVPGIVAESSFTFLFHGVTLRLPAENPEEARRALRAMPGVEALYEEEEFRPSLYASLAQIGAPQVWSALGGRSQAGQGVRVAILDSGIDPQHPMMSSAGLAYPPGTPLGDARYTSEKVIAARIYVRPTDPPIAGEGTPIPGERGSAHGTHLAGIVAGAPVTATYLGGAVPLSGVAPGAWLMNYRVFYPPPAGWRPPIPANCWPPSRTLWPMVPRCCWPAGRAPRDSCRPRHRWPRRCRRRWTGAVPWSPRPATAGLSQAPPAPCPAEMKGSSRSAASASRK